MDDEGPMVRERQIFDLKSRRHGVPALISFFLPGVGQLIKGQFLAALIIWVATALAILSCAAAIGFLLTPMFWLLQTWDAYANPDAETKREIDRLQALQPLRR